MSESLELAEQLEDRDGVASSKLALGFFSFAAGETAPARDLLNEALTAFEELGNSEEQAVALFNIGLVDLAEDKLDAAHASFVQSLSRAKRIGALRWTATATVGFAAVAARRGQNARAAQLLGAVESLLLEIGAGLEPFEDELRLKTLAEVRARLGDEGFSEAWAQGQGCTPEEMAAYALSSD